MNKTMIKLLSLCKKSSKQVSSAQYLLEYMEMLVKIEELEKNGTNAATLKSLKAIRDTYKSPYDKKMPKLKYAALTAFDDAVPTPQQPTVSGTYTYTINTLDTGITALTTASTGLFEEELEEMDEE